MLREKIMLKESDDISECELWQAAYGEEKESRGLSDNEVLFRRVADAQLDKAIRVIHEEIEKVENPYDENDETSGLWFHVGFEVARQRFLALLEADNA